MSQCGLINRNSNLTPFLFGKAIRTSLYGWLMKKKIGNDQRDETGTSAQSSGHHTMLCVILKTMMI
jgi:hypothetical protein